MVQPSEKKRHSSTASAKREHKKHHSLNSAEVVVPNPAPTARFCQILELGSAFIWGYLSFSNVISLLNTVSDELSVAFANQVTLKAIQTFAVENDTHLGRKCGCDWMRSLNFKARWTDECVDPSPYVLDENLPILQVPGGALAFLNALALTKTLMMRVSRRYYRCPAIFTPIICPLVSEKNKPRLAECTESDVKRVMNRIFRTSGTRFFKEFKTKRPAWTPNTNDFLDYHWDGIESTVCKYCDELATKQTVSADVAQIRTNCREVYRPLKDVMTKNLQFVRIVPRPRSKPSYSYLSLKYEGLVAGITKDGILCGAYLVKGQYPLPLKEN